MAACRILVVDDDPWIIDILAELLRDEGHIPILAGTGEEALRLVRQSPPDLILLDLKLPGLNGEEFMDELRRAKLEIPIIILSAAAQPPRSDLLLQVSAYLAKPFDILDLLEMVDRFCPTASLEPVS